MSALKMSFERDRLIRFSHVLVPLWDNREAPSTNTSRYCGAFLFLKQDYACALFPVVSRKPPEASHLPIGFFALARINRGHDDHPVSLT